jgi:hypothetical protein
LVPSSPVLSQRVGLQSDCSRALVQCAVLSASILTEQSVPMVTTLP